MHKIYYVLFILMLLCFGCDLQINRPVASSNGIAIERFDRIESKFLINHDLAALQQMKFDYPLQTHVLIENILKLGNVDELDINSSLYNFYKDTTLQKILREVNVQYADLSDVNKDLTECFARLKVYLPNISIPHFYTFIGALTESIIVIDGYVGISLDKYLGQDFYIYSNYYPENQRRTMVRSMIVPDCIGFYLLSCYPSPQTDTLSHLREIHRGKIQWLVNQVTKKNVFTDDNVVAVDKFMQNNKNLSIEDLLSDSTIVLTTDNPQIL